MGQKTSRGSKLTRKIDRKKPTGTKTPSNISRSSEKNPFQVLSRSSRALSKGNGHFFTALPVAGTEERRQPLCSLRLNPFVKLHKLRRRSHGDSAVLIQCPELRFASIRGRSPADGKLPGVIDLTRAFEVERF